MSESGETSPRSRSSSRGKTQSLKSRISDFMHIETSKKLELEQKKEAPKLYPDLEKEIPTGETMEKSLDLLKVEDLYDGTESIDLSEMKQISKNRKRREESTSTQRNRYEGNPIMERDGDKEMIRQEQLLEEHGEWELNGKEI